MAVGAWRLGGVAALSVGVWVPAMILMLGQAGTEAISGNAGWVGAGLLGLVLAWLFFVHLPAKDKQLENKDKLVEKIIEGKDALSKELTGQFRLAIEAVSATCTRELKEYREATEARYREVMDVLNRTHDSVRESIHTTKNMQAVAQVKEQLAAALQSTDVAVWTKKLDGTLESWNAAAERILGWRQGEVVGRSVYERVIPPDKGQEELEVLQKIAAGQRLAEYETERMHRSGRRVRLLVVTSPIRDTAGKVIGASTLARPSE